MRQLHASHGLFRGLFKGFWPMLWRDVPNFGIYFSAFELLKPKDDSKKGSAAHAV